MIMKHMTKITDFKVTHHKDDTKNNANKRSNGCCSFTGVSRNFKLKRRLNTIENHMGATEAAPYSSRKCEREDVEPPLNTNEVPSTAVDGQGAVNSMFN